VGGRGLRKTIVEKRGLKQISDAGEIDGWSTRCWRRTRAVADYKAGKESVQLPGRAGDEGDEGKGQSAQVNEILRRKLGG